MIAALIALGSGVILWLLTGFVGVLPVAIAVLGFYVIGSVGATIYLNTVGRSLAWQVKKASLPVVRQAVDLNMKGAYFMIVLVWPFLLIATARGAAHLWLVAAAFSVPFSVWSTGVERRLKTM